jgi:hypothetical protein
MTVHWIHMAGFYVQIINLGFPQITGTISDYSLLKDSNPWSLSVVGYSSALHI